MMSVQLSSVSRQPTPFPSPKYHLRKALKTSAVVDPLTNFMPILPNWSIAEIDERAWQDLEDFVRSQLCLGRFHIFVLSTLFDQWHSSQEKTDFQSPSKVEFCL